MTRNQRLMALGGAVAAAIVVVVLVVVFTGGNGGSPTPTVPANAGSFLAGVPQHGDTLGNPDAPATLLVFEDPQCPYCREWSLGALPSAVREFVKTGKVKLEWRGIAIIGPNSVLGLQAAYAAAQQNRLWNLIDQLYQRQGEENSGWITTSLLRSAAQAAHANPTRLLASLDSTTVHSALTRAASDASRYQVQGTPTFVLLRPPSTPKQVSVPALDAGTFDAALASALR